MPHLQMFAKFLLGLIIIVADKRPIQCGEQSGENSNNKQSVFSDRLADTYTESVDRTIDCVNSISIKQSNTNSVPGGLSDSLEPNLSKNEANRVKRFADGNSSMTKMDSNLTASDVMEPYPDGTDSFFHGANDSFTTLSSLYDVPEILFLPPVFIGSLEDSLVLLLDNKTQQYLDSFENELQRKIVSSQLLFCPHTPLCSFKYEVYLDSSNFKSPCERCSCEDCTADGNCCPDILEFGPTDEASNTDCLTLSLKDKGSTYETVTKCQNAENTPCSGDGDYKTFVDILPVTDTTTNITYRNKKCAICNHVSTVSLLTWQPQLICERADEAPMLFKTEKELIQFAAKSRSCDIIYFMPDKTVRPVSCMQVINTCNITGNWSVYDPLISRACSAYENIYTMKIDYFLTRFYRNIFCALCNGETPQAVLMPIFSYDGGVAPIGTYAFSGLLKFSFKEEENNIDTDGRCEEGYVYDNIQETCLELTCPPLRILTNNECELMFYELKNVVYKLKLRLYPLTGWSENFNNLSRMQKMFSEELEFKLQSRLFELNILPPTPDFSSHMFSFYSDYSDVGSISSNTICSMGLYVGRNETCPEGQCILGEDANFFEVDLNFDVADEHNQEDIVKLASGLQAETLDIIINKSTFKFQVQKRDFGNREFSQHNTVQTLDVCSAGKDVVSLSEQKSCSLVSLSVGENECFEYKDGVICTAVDMTLNVWDYHFGSNGSVLFVCSDVYMNHSAQFVRKKKPVFVNSDASVILSLVCTVISLVCLAVSFVTFCLFPRLRTLPGKNNMCLIMALIIAQSIYLISSFGKLQSRSVGCKLVGVLTHFFWLTAMFWMHICTFHVFRVFTGIKALAVESEKKSFVVYSAYSFALSACLVVINIITSLASSNMAEFGYGKSTCYISSEKMVVFTFGIPVGFVIISNLFMFFFFVVKIKTAPVVQKDVKNERNDIIIFAKLSTLTGFTWIFGFIYTWTDIEVFSYLFIILNATQGVFLFFSFVCNKRVIGMYQNRSFGVTTSSEAYKSRMTESTKQSSFRNA